MEWEVEYTHEFGAWWHTLDAAEQVSVGAVVGVLQRMGVHLGFPHSSQVQSSKHGNMRELRIQHQGRPFRALYAFDPTRTAILLIGGDKTGNDRWYHEFVPVADGLYDDHLKTLEKEGRI